MTEDANNHLIPRWLSCFDKKREIYGRDQYFIASWNEFFSLFQSYKAIKDCLWNTALLLAKPEAIGSGKGDIIKNLLDDSGYQIIAVKRLYVDKKQTSALWQHSLGRYSDERFHLLVDLMASGPSVLFVVKNRKSHNNLPLSIQLTTLKGSTVPSERTENCLRSACSEIQSTFLNYIHTSDEPCDVVRELGILLSSKELHDLLHEIKVDSYSINTNMQLLLAPETSHNINDVACINRILIALDSISDKSARENFAKALKDCFDGNTHACEIISDALTIWKLDALNIDKIILRSKYIPLKREIKSHPFPSCELNHWHEYTTILKFDTYE
jgi:nucleoside diphosphate kinase